MSLTQQPAAKSTPMPADVGECSSCRKRNSHRATRCHACQEVLPWATGKVTATPQKTAPAKTAATPAQRPAQTRNGDDDDDLVWWQSIGWGVASFACAGGSYWALAAKEASGGWFRAKWWIVLLYTLGGKWLVAGIFIAMGLLCIAAGLMQYFDQNN